MSITSAGSVLTSPASGGSEPQSIAAPSSIEGIRAGDEFSATVRGVDLSYFSPRFYRPPDLDAFSGALYLGADAIPDDRLPPGQLPDTGREYRQLYLEYLSCRTSCKQHNGERLQ